MGLMWTLEATGAFSLEDAHAFCIGLDLQGHSDWRVPGIAELEEILGSGFRPSMRGGVQLLWSTTAAPERGAYAVDLRSGERTRVAVGMAHVVCVHTFAEHL
jgi:hypothetical protein